MIPIWLGPLISAQGGGTHLLTVALESPSADQGFFDGTYDNGAGAISPGTLNGATIRQVYTDQITGQLRVTLDGVRAQTFFTKIICSLGTFETASADVFDDSSLVSPSAGTLWAWDSAGNFVDGNVERITLV